MKEMHQKNNSTTRSKKYKYIDVLINPTFHFFSIFILAFFLRSAYQLIFPLYAPNDQTVLHTAIIASFAIILSSYLITFFLDAPTRAVYALAFPITFILFSTISIFIVLFRVEYHRPDLVIYFISTTIILSISALLHEKIRKFSFYSIPFGRSIKGELGRRVRIVEGRASLPPSTDKKIFSKLDGIVIDLKHPLPAEWEKFIANACINGIKIYDRDNLVERLNGYVPNSEFAHIVTEWRLGSKLYLIIKRYLDFIIALILLPFLVPLIIVCTLIIKLDSPGPGIFKQKRVGLGCKVFTVYKLRTMVFEEGQNRIINTINNDTRITKVGRILRKYRIDELPQVFNVLKGEMSWIGPRPETVELSQEYSVFLPLYLYRNCVRPGLSGWAAINQGYVGTLAETAQKINYDFYYIKNLSFELDLMIVFETIIVIMTGRGAK